MEVRKGYKQTEVGIIPDEWEIVALRDLVHPERKITYGIVVPGPVVQNGIPMIRAQDYSNGWVDLDKVYRVSNDIDKSYKRSRVITGDVLLTIVGNGVGNLAKVPPLYNGSNLTQQTARLSFNNKIANADYFLSVLLSEIGKREISNYTKSGVQPSLNLSDVDKFLVPSPPLYEQEAIAEALSDADALIEALECLIAKKRQVKQGAMQELFTGNRRLPGFSEEWKEKRLGELSEMGSGGTPLTSNPSFYDGDIPWVSIADMTKGGKSISSTERNLTTAGLNNSAAQMFPSGTVLYAMYASLGECSIADVSLCTSQAILGIRVKPSLHNEFLYYYLTYIKPQVKTMGQHGTQANLNKGMVQDFRLNLPSLPEQTAIAEILSDMDAEVTALEAKLSKAREVKAGMMSALLTGRVRLV